MLEWQAATAPQVVFKSVCSLRGVLELLRQYIEALLRRMNAARGKPANPGHSNCECEQPNFGHVPCGHETPSFLVKEQGGNQQRCEYQVERSFVWGGHWRRFTEYRLR